MASCSGDSGGSEVSKKIRAAIKAKLVELGAYVDEELPDYIMVMIANKKTKEQMKQDLVLFLNRNAYTFVDWLFEIFQRLQSVNKPAGKDEKTKKKKTRDKSRSDRDRKKTAKKTDDKTTHKHKSAKIDDSDVSKKSAKRDLAKAVAVVDNGAEDDLQMHALPIDDDIEAEISAADARAQRRKDGRKEAKTGGSSREARSSAKEAQKDSRHSARDAREHSKDTKESSRTTKETKERRARSPSPIAPLPSKRNIAAVQPMRHEAAPPHIDGNDKAVSKMPSERHRTERSVALSSVVCVSSQVHTRRTTVSAEMAPSQSLFMKAMHDAAKTATVKQTDKIAKKRHLSISSSSDGSPDRRTVQKKRQYRDEWEDEGRRKKKERRRVELKKANAKEEVDDYAEEDRDTLIVDDHCSRSRTESNTRFVITMSAGLNDRFQSKTATVVDGGTDEERGTDTVAPPIPPVRPIHPQQRRISLPPLSNSPPPKPTIIKRVPERKSTRPVKLKLAHRKVEALSDDRFEKETTSMNVDEQENNTTGQPIPVLDSDTRNVVKSEPGQTPVWVGQFPPVSIAFDDDDEEEEDDEEEDEDEEEGNEIDAKMASNGSGNYVSGAFNAELPPTQMLSRPAVAPADKLMERCKFWPACRQGDACPYVHPVKHCLTFPNCPFGEKCMYIHPNCKFDGSCTRPKCPFTHASKKSNAVAPSARPVFVSKSMSAPMNCKFGAKCTNIRCTFKHPKPCRFGADCLNQSCPFIHPRKSVGAATEAKYKWKADRAMSTEDVIAT